MTPRLRTMISAAACSVAAVLFAHAAQAETAAGCTIVPKVDYFGFDLPGGLNLAETDATACAKLCSDHLLCTHFTFVWGGCYLKVRRPVCTTSRTSSCTSCAAAWPPGRPPSRFWPARCRSTCERPFANGLDKR